MTEHHFKKGDPVPQWVEMVEPAGIDLHGFFAIDVLVERHAGGATIYPERELQDGECLMRFDGDGKGAWVTGGPTIGYTHPKGDPRNDFKPFKIP